MNNNALPLGFLQAGCSAVVRECQGGKSLRQRLIELGLVHGTRVRVVKNDRGGPLIISVGEGRLAIGRGMALKIMVEEAS